MRRLLIALVLASCGADAQDLGGSSMLNGDMSASAHGNGFSRPTVTGLPPSWVVNLAGDDLNASFADKASVTSWGASPSLVLTPTQADAAHEPLVEKNAINGHTAVLFNGTANLMSFSGSTSTLAFVPNTLTFDMFFVARWDGNGNGSGASSYWLSNTQASTTRGLSLLIKSTRATSGFISKGDGTYHVNTLATPTTGTVSAGVWHLLEVHGDATNWKTSIDGGADESTAFANALTTGNMTNNLAIGGNYTAITQFFDFTIAHMIVYSRDLSSAERSAARAYLAGQYGTMPVTPTMRVAFLGDSITFGAHANINFVPRIESDINALSHGAIATANFGHNGDTSTQILSRWTNNVRGQGYTHVVFLGCVNDLAGAADTTTDQATAEAECETNVNTLVSQATSDGLSVVLMTLTPWATYVGSTTNKQDATATYDTYIKGKAGAGVTVIDLNSDATLGDGNTPPGLSATGTIDSGDGLHPGQDGSDRIAALIETALGF